MKTVAGILTVVLLVAGGCIASERNADDVAHDNGDARSVTSQTGSAAAPKTLFLDVAASTSGPTSGELVRVLKQAEERTVTFDLLTASLVRRGLSDEAATDAVCDALGEVVLRGPSLSRDDVFRIIVSNLVISLNGDRFSALFAGQAIVNELSDGTANDPVWARVALSKSGHCRQKPS